MKKRERNLYPRIKKGVSDGSIKKQFRATDIKFLKNSRGFLAKHCEGNPGGYTLLFVRIATGLYRLKKTSS